jgi:hypothetical protein
MNFTELLENPIWVKHWRSRMRLAQVLPTATVVFVVGVLIVWGGWILNGYTNGYTFGVLVALQVTLLAAGGGLQVASSVNAARLSGVLDFHRVSPLHPLTTTLGFFFGAPIREYVLFATTLPFSLFCVAMGAPDFWGLLQVLVIIVAISWFLHAFAILNALNLPKPRAGSAARGIMAIVGFAYLFGPGMTLGVAQATQLVSQAPTLDFFGLALPWLGFALVYLIPATAFLLLAACRKMRSERAHAFSKLQALGCLVLLTALILGGQGNAGQLFEIAPIVVIYAVMIGALMLLVTITPTASEYAQGIRRAEKLEIARPRFWEDRALNRIMVGLFCVVVLVGATIATRHPAAQPGGILNGRHLSYSVAVPVAIFVVAYFGLAHQYFALAFPRRGGALMGLFLFMAWVVPLVLGAVLLAAGSGDRLGAVVMSLSPLAGIALSTGVAEETFTDLAQIAALGPAIGFAFLFNNLVVIARRRADRALHAAAQAKAAARTRPEAVAVR